MADDSTTSVMSGGAEFDDRPPSDWDEQDLLTIDEASERLVDEIAQLDRAAAAETDPDARTRLETRRARLQASLRSITAGPTELAKV